MEKYDKKIVMFYRGKDNSNKISSSTQNEILKYKDILDVEFINLDKRNYDKYFAKSGLDIDIAYVWHDEEILIDYINENYQDIELRIYSDKNASIITTEKIKKQRKYIIAQTIIDDYKETFGYINLWKIKDFEDEIIEVRIFKLDYDEKPQHEKNKYYTSKGSAKEALKLKIKREIKQSEDMIKYYQEKIKKDEDKLNKL